LVVLVESLGEGAARGVREGARQWLGDGHRVLGDDIQGGDARAVVVLGDDTAGDASLTREQNILLRGQEKGDKAVHRETANVARRVGEACILNAEEATGEIHQVIIVTALADFAEAGGAHQTAVHRLATRGDAITTGSTLMLAVAVGAIGLVFLGGAATGGAVDAL